MTKTFCNKCNAEIVIDGQTTVLVGKVLEPVAMVNPNREMVKRIKEVEVHICSKCFDKHLKDIIYGKSKTA